MTIEAIARAARAYIGLNQKELGKSAKVSSRTVFKLEEDGNVTKESLNKILAVFTACGIVMLYGDHGKANGIKFTKELVPNSAEPGGRRSYCLQTIIFSPSVARAARAYTGLSQDDFGDLAGVAQRTIHRCETIGNVRDDQLGKILGAHAKKGIIWVYDQYGRIEGMLFPELDADGA